MTAWKPTVPKHWPVHRADAAFSIVSGSTPKTSDAENWGGDIVWVTPDDQGRGSVDTLDAGRRHISKAGLDSCSTTLVPAGSVLLSSRAPIGYVSVAGRELCTNQGFKTFVAKEGVQVEPKFLMWWLRSSRPQIEALGSGTTFKELSKRAAAGIPIPIPPLHEQHAIVETIEQMLSRFEAGRATIQAARHKLEILQGALDNHATFGLLHRVAGDREDALTAVAACRGDRNPGDILCAPAPADVAVPETWVWSSVDELAEVQAGAAKSKKLERAEGCVERPYLSVANVQRGRLALDDVKTMWVRGSKLDDLTLRPGDVLFNEGGDKDKLGRGWVWEGQIEGCVHQNHVFRARLRADGVDPRWLSHWGNVFGRWWFHARGSQTTGIASINKSVLRSLPVPVPPPFEQQAILDGLDRRSTKVTHALCLIDAATPRATGLRHSILKAAFEGRLTSEVQSASSIAELEEAIA